MDLEKGGGWRGCFTKKPSSLWDQREERNPSGVQSFSELAG